MLFHFKFGIFLLLSHIVDYFLIFLPKIGKINFWFILQSFYQNSQINKGYIKKDINSFDFDSLSGLKNLKSFSI